MLGPSSPWNKFAVSTEKDDSISGKQNSSASSSLLAAPLNDSLSPQSERASLKWEEVAADDADDADDDDEANDAKDVKDVDDGKGFDLDSWRPRDRDSAYEGATPPPKRQQPRQPNLQLQQQQQNSFLRRSKHKPDRQQQLLQQQRLQQQQQQTTPSHLISDSPFKPPLLMSTPRQRSMDFSNDALLAAPFGEVAPLGVLAAPLGVLATPFGETDDDCFQIARFNGSGLKFENSTKGECCADTEKKKFGDRRRPTIRDGDEEGIERLDEDEGMEVGGLGHFTSWEEQESREEEEEGIWTMPVVGEWSSGVEPKNLLTLFDSVSEDER